MSRVKNWLFRWGPALIWMSAIFFFSGLNERPPTPGLEDFRWDDKMQHFAAYAMLAALIWRALYSTIKLSKRAILSLAISIGYAITDELHQFFTPNREPSLADVAADSIGAAFIVIILYMLFKRSKEYNRRFSK